MAANFIGMFQVDYRPKTVKSTSFSISRDHSNSFIFSLKINIETDRDIPTRFHFTKI